MRFQDVIFDNTINPPPGSRSQMPWSLPIFPVVTAQTGPPCTSSSEEAISSVVATAGLPNVRLLRLPTPPISLFPFTFSPPSPARPAAGPVLCLPVLPSAIGSSTARPCIFPRNAPFWGIGVRCRGQDLQYHAGIPDSQVSVYVHKYPL